jgi:hypothetical protein
MRPHRILIAFQLLVAFIAFSGCSSWKALKTPPAEYFAQKPRTLVRLNTRKETWLKLHHARLEGDSLVGEAFERGTVAFPLDSVLYIETSQFSPGKTMGLVLLGGAVAGVVLLGSALSSTVGD